MRADLPPNMQSDFTQERLGKMKETTGDAWVELQTDFDEMWQDMGHSVAQAKNNFLERAGNS